MKGAQPLKKTNTVSTIAAVVLFIAMAAYLGVYIFQSTQQTLQTSPAVKTTLTDTADLTGIAVRQEEVLLTGRSYVFVSATDGAAVSRGEVLASAMDSEAAMERAGRKKELQSEISRMEALLSGLSSVGDLTERDSAVRKAVYSLAGCVATGDLSELPTAAASISTLLMSGGSETVSQEELDALKSELTSMNNNTYSDSEDIISAHSGVFTTVLDGWEAVTPDSLSDLTPSGLSALMTARQDVPQGAIGKVITDFRWYFAVLMDKSAAGELTVGDYVPVDLGRHYSENVTMRVESISSPQSGQCAVVLSTLKAMDETLAMRCADAQMITRSYTGLRVPTKALHVDENGDAFVYVAAGGLVDVRHVSTIYQSSDYYLVEVEAEADSLREGDEIIVRGKNVEEGMIIK